jgi:hypothetical protein
VVLISHAVIVCICNTRASTPEWMPDDFVPLEEPGEDSSSEISYYSVDFNM